MINNQSSAITPKSVVAITTPNETFPKPVFAPQITTNFAVKLYDNSKTTNICNGGVVININVMPGTITEVAKLVSIAKEAASIAREKFSLLQEKENSPNQAAVVTTETAQVIENSEVMSPPTEIALTMQNSVKSESPPETPTQMLDELKNLLWKPSPKQDKTIEIMQTVLLPPVTKSTIAPDSNTAFISPFNRVAPKKTTPQKSEIEPVIKTSQSQVSGLRLPCIFPSIGFETPSFKSESLSRSYSSVNGRLSKLGSAGINVCSPNIIPTPNNFK